MCVTFRALCYVQVVRESSHSEQRQRPHYPRGSISQVSHVQESGQA